MGSVPGRAVVVGGSLSGLLAARVLGSRFREVVLLERDELGDGVGFRKGIPQGRHVHVLLKRGERILERFFPGILEELRREGGQSVDMAGDTLWFHFGNWKKRFASGMTMRSQSRGLLEGVVRRRLRALPNVVIRGGVDVTGFATGENGIAGVRIGGRRAGEDGATIDARLVVDATGKGTRTPAWLEELGFGRPEVTEVKVDVGYASRFYRPRRDGARDWKALLLYPRPLGTRLGVLLPIEDDQWLVTLVGWFGDHPANDETRFVEFARSLPAPHLHRAIASADPVSTIATYRFPADRRRHFERMRLPDGLVVVGDAFCTFNPIYGQGMTTGALGAETLASCLDEGGFGRGFGRRFHERLARGIDTPWTLATTEDFRYPRAEGTRPPGTGFLLWYTAQVHRLSWVDPFVMTRFLQVMHLLRRPSSLFHPYILARALTTRPRPLPLPLAEAA